MGHPNFEKITRLGKRLQDRYPGAAFIRVIRYVENSDQLHNDGFQVHGLPHLPGYSDVRFEPALMAAKSEDQLFEDVTTWIEHCQANHLSDPGLHVPKRMALLLAYLQQRFPSCACHHYFWNNPETMRLELRVFHDCIQRWLSYEFEPLMERRDEAIGDYIADQLNDYSRQHRLHG